MYATIIQAVSNDGVQQVAYVPLEQGGAIAYTRVTNGNKQRGISGAWYEIGAHLVPLDYEVVGAPMSVRITSSDEAQYLASGKYTTLLQKLVRAVEGSTKPSGRTLHDVSEEVCGHALNNPDALVRYTPALSNISFVRKEVEVTPAPMPVVQVQPTVVEPVVETPAFLTAESPRQTSGTLPRTYAPLSVPKVNPKYIDRSFDGITLFNTYDKARKRGRSVLATGDAGTGKSISVEQYAASAGLPYVVVECSVELTTDHTQGRLNPVPMADGQTSWEWWYSELATAIQRPSVILLNEFSRQPATNATLWLGLLNERKLRIPLLNEVLDVHPECLFVADQNLGSDYAGTTKQDSALYDRFHPKLEFEIDPLIEGALIPSPTLLDFANALRFVNKTERAKMRTRVGLRMLLAFVQDVQDYNLKFAVTSFVNNFAEAERSTVRMQFDTRYDAIASELGVDASSYTPSPSL